MKTSPICHFSTNHDYSQCSQIMLLHFLILGPFPNRLLFSELQTIEEPCHTMIIQHSGNRSVFRSTTHTNYATLGYDSFYSSVSQREPNRANLETFQLFLSDFKNLPISWWATQNTKNKLGRPQIEIKLDHAFFHHVLPKSH